ncbi:AAA family ATPase [Streptomyces sp. NPDC058620]|uniref:AAA family ATPase n=1 Tax=Streptomyces sp. NPDC058620 TaxID=3346560 RepID=UPI00364FEBC4
MTTEPERSSHPVPFVTRVRIESYKSIATCDVALGPLTVLAGYNAAGKSNFLDAIRFVRDALEHSPAKALAARGGLDRVLFRSPEREGAEQAASFSICLDLQLVPEQGDGLPRPALYAVEIGRGPAGEGAHVVLREESRLQLSDDWTESFVLTPDGLDSTDGLDVSRRALSGRRDRLFLSAAALQGPFFSVETALLNTAFYELDSAALRATDDEASRHSRLGPAGEHIGHVLGLMADEYPLLKEETDASLRAVVPASLGVDERREGNFSSLQARFWTADQTNPLPYWEAVNSGAVAAADPHVQVFHQQQLSEGTVRAAGVLTALFQPDAANGTIPLLAIEEPELAIHPSKAGALFEAAESASLRTQIIVTTQSSDFLDDEHVRPEHLRMVEMVGGVTYVGELDARTRHYLEERPDMLPELHRKEQLRPAQLTEGTP